MKLSAFIGKTIKNINEECSNQILITFTDGSTYEVCAECESSSYSIPFFEVYKMPTKTRRPNNNKVRGVSRDKVE